MKRKRFTETQIVAVLHEASGGTSIREVCRRHGITETTFFRWRAKYVASTAGWCSRRLNASSSSRMRTGG